MIRMFSYDSFKKKKRDTSHQYSLYIQNVLKLFLFLNEKSNKLYLIKIVIKIAPKTFYITIYWYFTKK